MEKIQLNIFTLVAGHTHGSYNLILTETEGRRKLPVVIGTFEAQAIATEIERIVPQRPMTHDLLVNTLKIFNIKLVEVVIYQLTDGVFYSRLVCRQASEIHEIDARTSDAVALAIRCNCPIYTFNNILEAVTDNEIPAEKLETVENNQNRPGQPGKSGSDLGSVPVEQLQKMLDEAIEVEDYIKAALIRDEMNRRK